MVALIQAHIIMYFDLSPHNHITKVTINQQHCQSPIKAYLFPPCLPALATTCPCLQLPAHPCRLSCRPPTCLWHVVQLWKIVGNYEPSFEKGSHGLYLARIRTARSHKPQHKSPFPPQLTNCHGQPTLTI